MANIIDPQDVKEFEDNPGSGFTGILKADEVVYYEFTAPSGKVFATRPQSFETQATKDAVKAAFITQLENATF